MHGEIMRVMAIDIGTNSTLDLTADVRGSRLKVVERGIVRNRLGADVGEDGMLSGELLDYNRSILADLAAKAQKLGCERIGAVGTHALRRAVNAGEFTRIAEYCGVPMEVISDTEEARLAWQGVFDIYQTDAPRWISKADASHPLALLDVGGGSTELSVGDIKKLQSSESIPIGGVALGRRFFRHDPPAASEIQAALEHVHEAFADWKGYMGNLRRLVGIAGSIYALACLTHSVTGFHPGAVEGRTLTNEAVNKWRERLLKMDLLKRRALPSMPPARAESIHAGALIVREILEITGIAVMTTSERGLLYGLAMKLASD